MNARMMHIYLDNAGLFFKNMEFILFQLLVACCRNIPDAPSSSIVTLIVFPIPDVSALFFLCRNASDTFIIEN